MKILLISPLGFPINKDSKYVGIEKLVWYFCRELSKVYEVGVFCHAESTFPDGVKTFPIDPPNGDGFLLDELALYQRFQYELRNWDVIHDFSHQHLTARYMPNMPTVNVFWHAPSTAQYPKAPYNIVGLSRWACREFMKYYHQLALYQNAICIDTDLYKLSNRHRNDRFFAIGRMGPEKGNLNAIMLCKALGVPLDIIAARGTELKNAPLTDYEKQVQDLCDGKQIRLLGDLGEAEKIKVMQTNKALIYATSHPEVTNHKCQECMLCGMPVIMPNIGAAPEIVTQGVNGYLCNNQEEFLNAMAMVDKLDIGKTYKEVHDRWSIPSVVSTTIPFYEKVANGERWK